MSAIQSVKVRFLRPYQAYKTGQVVPVTGGLARTLELQRYAIRYQEPPQLEFADAPEPQGVEATVAPQWHGKRGRRRRDP